MDFIAFDYTLILRLVTAIVLGGIIGLERGGNNHEAGLRTHMLLCMGSALVMVISICVCKQYEIPSELLRMSAQILSGVGFLGAGSIIATGNKIRGITTAAGLWTTACIGIAIGAGYYILSVSTVALMLFVMLGLRPLTKKIQANSAHHRLSVDIESKSALKGILSKFAEKNIEIVHIHLDELDSTNDVLEMELKLAKHMTLTDVISEVMEISGVRGFKTLD